MADKNPNAPRGHSVGTGWPSTRYSPDGAQQVFKRPEDVPDGWADTPDAFKAGLQKPEKVHQELTKPVKPKPLRMSVPHKSSWPDPQGDE